jgi:predicted RNase H-like HicB family nuclease
MMSRYIAFAHHGGRAGWGISFPDFPGCVSAADTFAEVIEQGAQALRFHVEGMIEDGYSIPQPRQIEALLADPEIAADLTGAIVTLVPLLPPRARPLRVNVVIDANLLSAIDQTAKRLGLNRSEFLSEAARRMLVTPDGGKPIGGSERAEFIQGAARAPALSEAAASFIGGAATAKVRPRKHRGSKLRSGRTAAKKRRGST